MHINAGFGRERLATIPAMDELGGTFPVKNPSIVYLKDVIKLNLLQIVTCNDTRTIHL